MPEIEHNIKEVEFGPQHVGQKVTCLLNGKGVIHEHLSFDSPEHLNFDRPVIVKFGIAEKAYTKSYPKDGTLNGIRILFIGHDVKITVEEEELPERLICPVCKVEHEPYELDFNGSSAHVFKDVENDCPFMEAAFGDREIAEYAMKNLIKAFEGK